MYAELRERLGIGAMPGLLTQAQRNTAAVLHTYRALLVCADSFKRFQSSRNTPLLRPYITPQCCYHDCSSERNTREFHCHYRRASFHCYSSGRALRRRECSDREGYSLRYSDVPLGRQLTAAVGVAAPERPPLSTPGILCDCRHPVSYFAPFSIATAS